MKKTKTIIIALILTLALVITASAASGIVEATLHYRDIKVTMNGEQIALVDANGNSVEPFIIDGTTYLPLRVVSNALGLTVGWDDATSTVSLTEAGAGTQVYITRTGSKYHHDGTCNGGTYWPVPFETATGMGLTPCDKCVGR